MQPYSPIGTEETTSLARMNRYLFLTCFSLLLFLPGIANLPVIDRDEAHFAQATRQMLQTGQYFQIRFQEKTRFQKPPGINWLQAVSVKWFSDAEATAIWPYRLPSVFGALCSVLMLYLFAKRFIPSRVAFLSATFLAASLLLVIEAHMAVIDSALLSAVLLMQGSLWVIYTAGVEKKEVPIGWALAFWLAMAYGFLLKGVTPLVGCLTLVALCVSEKRVDWLSGLRLFPGIALFAILSLSWLSLVNQAEQSNYLLQMVQKDLIPKLQGGHESHGQPPLFHLAILPVTFWPASLFLWQAAKYGFQNRSQTTVRFLLAWIIPTWVFFELMPTKLPQYVLPTFPAIAVLCALAVMQADGLKKPGLGLRLLQILWGGLSYGIAAVCLVLSHRFLGELTPFSVSLFMVVALFCAVTVYFAWHAAYRRASYTLVAMSLIAFPILFSGFLPELKPLWITRQVTEVIKQYPLSSKTPLLVVGFSEPSLVFHLNTDFVQFTETNTAIEAMDHHPEQLLLIEETLFEPLARRFDWTILAEQDGYHYSKGKTIRLLLVRKNSPGGEAHDPI